MATANSVTLTFCYTGTEFTRKFKINDVAAEDIDNVKTKIRAYNADIPAADKKIFISDDYDDEDPNNIIGEFNGIVAAQIDEVEETNIPLLNE